MVTRFGRAGKGFRRDLRNRNADPDNSLCRAMYFAESGHMDITRFHEDLAQVGVGWDADRLVRHAGPPESRTDDVYRYSCDEDGRGCVRYSYVTFRMAGGRVAEITSGGGQKRLQ
jgi:hypothetical protein